MHVDTDARLKAHTLSGAALRKKHRDLKRDASESEQSSDVTGAGGLRTMPERKDSEPATENLAKEMGRFRAANLDNARGKDHTSRVMPFFPVMTGEVPP